MLQALQCRTHIIIDILVNCLVAEEGKPKQT